ncbi:hypothetical protein L195_g057261, partial [Trifolium pratense]
MVYYVDDAVNKGWNVAVHLKPRDLYEMGEELEEEVYENVPYQEQELENFNNIDEEYVELATNHMVVMGKRKRFPNPLRSTPQTQGPTPEAPHQAAHQGPTPVAPPQGPTPVAPHQAAHQGSTPVAPPQGLTPLHQA